MEGLYHKHYGPGLVEMLFNKNSVYDVTSEKCIDPYLSWKRIR
jgi:hypothetical protein